MRTSQVTSCKLIERPIYGSSRIGIDNTQLELIGYTAPTGGITTYELGLKQYELVNHLGNVLSTVSDKKIPHTTNGTDIDYYLADITSATDYYPFGSPMDGRTFSSDKYRFGFNGKEKDDELKGEGNSLDFGGRIYDSRLGRWLSMDPLMKKHPTLSPYNYCGNNPVVLVDFDGKDFGIRVNEENKTIVVVANIYTSSAQAYNQAMNAKNQWESAKTNVYGYTVTFEINVVPPPPPPTDDEIKTIYPYVNFYRKKFLSKKIVLDARKLNRYRHGLQNNKIREVASKDPIGNSYLGVGGPNSKNYPESDLKFDGGQTESGKYVDMNTHDRFGNLGDFVKLVSHEFGHLFGLDDKGKGDYYAKGGIMEYNGFDLSGISNSDISNIIKFAIKSLKEGTEASKVKVKVIN